MTETWIFRKIPEIDDQRKIFCNNCKTDTHHQLKSSHDSSWADYIKVSPGQMEPVFIEDFYYRLWYCCGCDTGVLEESYTNDGMGDDKGRIWESTYHPKRKRHDLASKRYVQLDSKLKQIYREIIDSFNGEMPILCSIGMRALIEGICDEKNIKGRTLELKIPKLEKYLPKNIVDNLHSFRFMGNVAAHELQAPSERELRLAIEVIEDLLNYLYDLDYKVSKLPRPTENKD